MEGFCHSVQNGMVIITHNHWPSFLYPEDEYNLECYDHGLVNCYLCIPLLPLWPWQLTNLLGLPRGSLCLLIDLPMLTNCLTDMLTDCLTDAMPRLLILSGLSQHLPCMLSDPYLSCLCISDMMTHAPMGCTIYSGLMVACTGRPDLVTFCFNN
jgi:hypothetical protein